MQLFKYFYRDHKILHLGVFVSIILIVLIKFIFDDKEEIFKGGAEVGNIIYQLSLAYLASFIFYFIVVYLKYFNEKKHIGPYIASRTGSVSAAIFIMLFEMFKEAGYKADDIHITNLTDDQITKMASKINPNDDAPSAYVKTRDRITTWWTFFVYWKEETEKRINVIFRHSQFLEAEHIKLLLRVQENSFFSTLEFIEELPGDSISNSDCSIFKDQLISLYKSSKDLREYCCKQFGEKDCSYSNF